MMEIERNTTFSLCKYITVDDKIATYVENLTITRSHLFVNFA